MTNTLQIGHEHRGQRLGKGVRPMDGWIINQRLLVEDRLDRYRDEARRDRLVAAAKTRAASNVTAATAARAAANDPGRAIGEPIARSTTRPVAVTAGSVGPHHDATADCGCPESAAAA
jgi:hypothetical protein